ncbi:hypothetical protein LI82_07675 [Methanococcoides methylutens]|uniref:Uncharacterized protein n=1 Tax=Methanococcoides methylutens TaxID=2226 RepID=A0A099T0L1_METMT|nr:hypothetical protein [Methanococcoides methylutens]KGK98715.1 hypothetical protein LI82_07675 [Methanococcoides methylutens]
MGINSLTASSADSLFLFTNIDMVIILLLSLSLLALNYYLLNKKSCFEEDSHKFAYYILNFVGFCVLFLALLGFFKDPEFNTGYTFILFSEGLFWYSLRLSRKEEIQSSYGDKEYTYNSLISYMHTSLVGSLYMFFAIGTYIINNFTISENSILIFSTMLLISVIKVFYGIYMDDKGDVHYHFWQLHIYAYIFVIISVFLSATTFLLSLLFSLNGYLLGTFSANEISQNGNKKFHNLTFSALILFLAISGFYLMINNSSYSPLLPLLPVALLMARTLVQFKEKDYSDESQDTVWGLSIITCVILYLALTWNVFYMLMLDFYNAVLPL